MDGLIYPRASQYANTVPAYGYTGILQYNVIELYIII